MSRARICTRREGFTLVELLTVIGIISLLISILLPSLSRARDQARKLRVQAQVSAIEKGLEMFQNDFKSYPDSGYGPDKIKWSVTWSNPQQPQPPNGEYMTGAHWLARALTGHDFLGVDNKGVMLQRLNTTSPDFVDLDAFRSDTTPPGVYSDRKGTYIDAPVFARDDDQTKFQNVSTGIYQPNGRLLVIDGYNFPILYYRANPRARAPFQEADSVVNGVFNQGDNAMITGGKYKQGSTVTPQDSWDFAGTGFQHGIGWFGNAGGVTVQNIHETPPNANPPYKGRGFADYVHDENPHESGNILKAQLSETFLLISAGKDGIYGTDDDVTNVKGTGL